VRLGLYGHTHKEDIQVTQSMSDAKNIGINFFAGSLTSLGVRNPSFNIIEFDAEYMIPLNIKTYSFNLDLANTNGSPSWGLLHDYLSYYSLPDLRPDNIYNLIAVKLRDDDNFAMQYMWDQVRRAFVKPTACN
jgi:hypothetical protein